jgi:hypothetical protein
VPFRARGVRPAETGTPESFSTLRPEHPARRGSGSFGLPRDLLGRSPVARLAFEVPGAARHRLPDVRALLGFTPPSEPLLRAGRVATRERAVPDLPLLGFVFAPPPTCLRCVHSRRRCRRHRPRVSRPSTRSALVVLHHLDGFLRNGACGLVASRYRSWGSWRFAHPWPPRGRSLRRSTGSVSRDAVHTPRRIPLVDSRTVSPRPLPSCRYRPGDQPALRSTEVDPHTDRFDPAWRIAASRRRRRAAGSKALLHRRVRSVPPALPRANALSFHGLCSPPRSFRAPSPRGGAPPFGLETRFRGARDRIPPVVHVPPPESGRRATRVCPESKFASLNTGATTEG